MTLSTQIEQATAPSRELDHRIMRFVNHGGLNHEPLHYTSSIDAALTLVPEGSTGIISISGGYAQLEIGDGRYFSADGANSALALCAAALKARNPTT